MSTTYDDLDRPAPAFLPLIAENIPLDDLAPYPHFVAWDPVWREGRNGKPGGWTKVLKNPRTGQNARSNDPATWGAAGDVVGRFDRVGFVVASDDPFGFLDLDDAIDPETDDLKPWAREIVDRFPTYWERSPSGKGLKGLIRGTPTRNRIIRVGDGQVEAFGSGKFTTLTGHRIVGTPATITDCQTELDRWLAEASPEPTTQPIAATPELDVDDQAVKDRALRMPKIKRLFETGNLTDYADDQSAAELGLLNGFVNAGATGSDQLDRLFRASALMRHKWERKDYRERTLKKALDGTVVPYAGWNQSSPARLVKLGNQAENGAVVRNPQDAGSGACVDEIAELRAQNAALSRQLAATRRRADQAEAELASLKLLQSATMTMLRSREMRPGEKVLGLVSLFEAEAAQHRGATDPEGWSTVPLGRLADAGGCSPDTAGKHLTTIASTGIIETRTITERDPKTGEVRKRRQIRLPAASDSASASDLAGRITLLSTAIPERDPNDHGWGGKRVCPDCGDVGTITITTIACAGCGNVLSTAKTEQTPADVDSPYPHLAPTKNGRGLSVPPYRQDAGTGQEERRAQARRDLEARARARADSWNEAPEPDDAPAVPWLPGFAPDPPDPWTDVAYGARS